MILFTYGTIPQFLIDNKIPHKHIGTATIQGIKIPNTPYPAVIPPINIYSYDITGQIIQVDDKWIDAIDDYEVIHYYRDEIKISNDRNGELLIAQIYWYDTKTSQKPHCDQI